MAKKIFITGTGTDVGKTFVTGLIVKKLRENGINAAYYKAAMSGNERMKEGGRLPGAERMKGGTLIPGDALYVKKVSGIVQPLEQMCPYVYEAAVSPHLASRIEGGPVVLEEVVRGFEEVCSRYEFVTMEGSGGILCPIRDDAHTCLFLEDVIQALGLDTLLVADAGLGSINAVGLTVSYLKQKHIPTVGLLLNRFNDSLMHTMIEKLTGLPTLACIPKNADCLPLSPDALNLIKGV